MERVRSAPAHRCPNGRGAAPTPDRRRDLRPHVLVGHSLGGFVARLYRQAHPNDVVGIVLVDAGHERQFGQTEFRKFAAPGKTLFPIVRAMTALGLTRLLISPDLAPSFFAAQEAGVPADIRPLLRAG